MMQNQGQQPTMVNHCLLEYRYQGRSQQCLFQMVYRLCGYAKNALQPQYLLQVRLKGLQLLVQDLT
jgi:hypothetical protein